LPDGIKITSLRVYPAASGPRPVPRYNPRTYLPKGATTKVLSSTPRLYNIYTYTYISCLSPPVVVPSRSVSPTAIRTRPVVVLCLNVFGSTLRSARAPPPPPPTFSPFSPPPPPPLSSMLITLASWIF